MSPLSTCPDPDCASCRADRDRLDDAIALVRDAGVPIPSASHREEMRTAVLAAGALAKTRPARTRTPWLVSGALVVAAAASVAFVVTTRDGEPPPAAPIATHRGTVHPAEGARFTTSTLPDEIVRLEDGSVTIDVDPLAAGERFRVVVGDGEVEVRGTAFTVVARRDHLVAVVVAHGRVEVRPTHGTLAVLGAGESWHVDPVVEPEPVPVPVPAPAPHPARVSTSHAPKLESPAPAPAPARTRDAIAYDEAWDAMREQHFAEAASGFARVVALAPNGGLADDARFWAAVAHSRANERELAILGFRDLVDHHASSVHADEASVMLGWLLLETGSLDEARTRFARGTNATAPKVRDSARAGLAALDRGAK